MPSLKSPTTTVQPGPGILPAGTVPASALLFIPGGSGSVATSVSYSGDGPWVDGTANPGTSVDAQLTKIIGDLTNDSGGSHTSPHAGSDRISARQSAQILADGSTLPVGSSVQGLIENILSYIAGANGQVYLGGGTSTNFLNGGGTGTIQATNAQLEGLLNGIINILAATPYATSGARQIGTADAGFNWIDGTTLSSNAPTTGQSVQVMFDNLVQDLTNDSGAVFTSQNAGSDRVSARQSTQALVDGTQPTGNSIQHLIESLIDYLGLGDTSGTGATLDVIGLTTTFTAAPSVIFNSGVVGNSITLSGSSHAGNNNTFAITSQTAPNQIRITHTGGQVTDLSGDINWVLDLTKAGSDYVGARTSTATFANGATITGASVQDLVEDVVSELAVNTTSSGTAASIQVLLGPSVLVTGLTGMSAANVGQQITISNSTSFNNGNFTIIAYVSSSQVGVEYVGQITDTNNGALHWSVPALESVAGSSCVGATTTSAAFTDGTKPTGSSVQAFADDLVGLLATSPSGSTSFIAGTTNPVQFALTAASNLVSSFSGLLIAISGAATPGNNGIFPIVDVLNSSELIYYNPSGATGDANNGSIHWSIFSGADRIGARTTSTLFADGQPLMVPLVGSSSVQYLFKQMVGSLGQSTIGTWSISQFVSAGGYFGYYEVQATSSPPGGFQAGMVVIIFGVTGPNAPYVNGTFVIQTAISATSFVIPQVWQADINGADVSSAFVVMSDGANCIGARGQVTLGNAQVPIGYPTASSSPASSYGLTQESVYTQLEQLIGYWNSTINVYLASGAPFTTDTIPNNNTVDTGFSSTNLIANGTLIVNQGNSYGTFNLAAANTCRGSKFYIADQAGYLGTALGGGGTAAITLVPNGSDTIDGVNASVNLQTPYGRWMLTNDGQSPGNWFLFSC